jgi:hypothetical protein
MILLRSPVRLATLLGLIQLFFILWGSLSSRILFRAWEKYGFTSMPGFGMMPKFISKNGLWFLVIPVLWAVVAAPWRSEGQRTRPVLAVMGFFLTVLIVLFFVLCTLAALRLHCSGYAGCPV